MPTEETYKSTGNALTKAMFAHHQYREWMARWRDHQFAQEDEDARIAKSIADSSFKAYLRRVRELASHLTSQSEADARRMVKMASLRHDGFSGFGAADAIY